MADNEVTDLKVQRIESLSDIIEIPVRSVLSQHVVNRAIPHHICFASGENHLFKFWRRRGRYTDGEERVTDQV